MKTVFALSAAVVMSQGAMAVTSSSEKSAPVTCPTVEQLRDGMQVTSTNAALSGKFMAYPHKFQGSQVRLMSQHLRTLSCVYLMKPVRLNLQDVEKEFPLLEVEAEISKDYSASSCVYTEGSPMEGQSASNECKASDPAKCAFVCDKRPKKRTNRPA